MSLTAATPMMAQRQPQDAAAMERELAITAYNYAAGCAERENYEEALEGLSHIPVNRLTPQQQGWADTLRMKCEAMVGHQMAQTEIPLQASEMMSLDDQSEAFLNGVRYYQADQYLKAVQCFDEVTEMSDGPKPQVGIEALYWKGQALYQLGAWEDCCKALIAFNDAKNEQTDSRCNIMAYYTMGYARMQAKKWHQARLNFERYLERETETQSATREDGASRLEETRRLEKSGGKGTYRQPLAPAKVEPTTGMTVELGSLLSKAYGEANKERQRMQSLKKELQNWVAPYIEETVE